mmetsp:Transcript_16059/g.34468  ORF Transcript_16059/g.34468 Transcript_16059/m.34468 type:complete len:205 (-) Transcript_16059:651-1265(-)
MRSLCSRTSAATSDGSVKSAFPSRRWIVGDSCSSSVRKSPAICRRFGSSKRGDQRTSRARRNSALAACSSPRRASDFIAASAASRVRARCSRSKLAERNGEESGRFQLLKACVEAAISAGGSGAAGSSSTLTSVVLTVRKLSTSTEHTSSWWHARRYSPSAAMMLMSFIHSSAICCRIERRPRAMRRGSRIVWYSLVCGSCFWR